MKLNELLIENSSRRDFLRSTGGSTLALATGNWKKLLNTLPSNPKTMGSLAKLYEQLPSTSKQTVNDFAFNIVNANMYGGSIESVKKRIKDGMILDYKNNKPVAPVEAIAGYYASLAEKGDAAYAITGDNPEHIDSIFPGFLDSIVSYSIDKFGPEAFVTSLSTVYKDLGYVSSGTFDAWKLALKNPALQKITGLTPEIAAAAGEKGIGLRKFVNNGIISTDDAKEYAGMTRQIMQQKSGQIGTKKPDQPKTDKPAWTDNDEADPPVSPYEKTGSSWTYKKSNSEKSDIENITPKPDDYIYGSSMHQPFESRLLMALSKI